MVQLAARVKSNGVFVDDFGGQRNIGGDDKISRLTTLNDFIVGYIETLLYLKKRNKRGFGDFKKLVGYQSNRNFCPSCSPEQNFLYNDWAGVGVYPDFHRLLG
jgi:hypothetical protein